MALDQAFAKKVNDHMHGVSALTMPSVQRMRLMTAQGSASAAGTELATGGGYTSGTGAPTIPWAAATTASPSVQATNAAITITNMPAATTTGVEVWNDTPERQEFVAWTGGSKTTAAGDTLSVASGALTSSLS